MASRELTFRFYEATVAMYEAAHNHKELSAWGGLVLEVVVCGMILGIELGVDVGVLELTVLTALLAAVTVLVLRYVLNQLEQKDINGAVSVAATAILREIAKENSETIDDKYLDLPNIGRHTYQFTTSLPAYLQDKAKLANRLGKGKKITRQMIVGLVISIPLGTTLLLWRH